MSPVPALEGWGVRDVERRPTPVNGSDLAVLVIQVSWALADAAHDLPAGRMPARRCAELADTLQALGYVLRVSAPDSER